jgi:hypothetical protein
MDGDEFAAKTAPLPSAFVAFGSDGGSLLAGLRIGEAIRRKRFSTIVPDGRRCASPLGQHTAAEDVSWRVRQAINNAWGEFRLSKKGPSS